jgi:hypothetical protein
MHTLTSAPVVELSQVGMARRGWPAMCWPAGFCTTRPVARLGPLVHSGHARPHSSFPGAAASVPEGLVETLTVLRLGCRRPWPAPYGAPTPSSR